jgi:YidC/Oxa1 family membrane protein insertase
MLMTIWQEYLYRPVFNGLIWIYNNWTDLNFGWAVVYMTIILRVVLLPLTLVSERDRIKNEALAKDIEVLDKQFANDQVQKKQEIRKILKKRKVHPWAKILVLGVQAVMLILLYQVFLRGITGEKILRVLFPSVEFPGVINTVFLGFDLGERYGLVWPAIIAIFLFIETYRDLRKKPTGLQKKDLTYFLLFPTFVFVVLWSLPMVKSLFVLSSLVCSLVIAGISGILFRNTKPAKKG